MLRRTESPRVLVVEDDLELVRELSVLLSNKGYEVETVSNGHAALAAAEVFCPEICLVDVNVPQVGGYELARRMRDQLQPPPLFANVTPFDQRDDWDVDVEFDIDFTKPSDPILVVQQLMDFLSNKHAQSRTQVHNMRHSQSLLQEYRRVSASGKP